MDDNKEDLRRYVVSKPRQNKEKQSRTLRVCRFSASKVKQELRACWFWQTCTRAGDFFQCENSMARIAALVIGCTSWAVAAIWVYRLNRKS